MNISPGIKQKIEIIRNAVKVAHRLGIKSPKVALLSGSEKVHPDFQSTIDAVALVKMCQDGAVEGCVVDGPFALDNAIDMDSARMKGIESPVAGSADILIMPNLEAGNIFCKGPPVLCRKNAHPCGHGRKGSHLDRLAHGKGPGKAALHRACQAHVLRRIHRKEEAG